MPRRNVEECPNGCNHDKRMAAGWGPNGRAEWCANAGACLDKFLKIKGNLNVEQSHCPPGCSEFVDERELRRMQFVQVNHGS